MFILVSRNSSIKEHLVVVISDEYIILCKANPHFESKYTTRSYNLPRLPFISVKITKVDTSC